MLFTCLIGTVADMNSGLCFLNTPSDDQPPLVSATCFVTHDTYFDKRYMSGAVGSVDRRVSSLATEHFHLEILKFQFSQYKTVMGQQHIASYYYEINKKLLV